MKVFQIWIGPTIPDHVKDCFNQMASFTRDEDSLILLTDNIRDDVPDRYEQRLVDVDELFSYRLSVDGYLKFTRANIATQADLIRFSMLATREFAGYTYMDSDVLMVRDPHQILSPNKDKTILYKSNDRSDFSCNGIITNPVDNVVFMKMVVAKCISYINDPEVRKVDIKDFMFFMDELRKENRDLCILRSRVSFLKLGYSAFCNRFRDGCLKQKDFDDVSNDPEVIGIHLWRPESLPRVKAYLLDEWSKQFLSLDYE